MSDVEPQIAEPEDQGEEAIKGLRDAAKRGKEASERAAALERENALLRSGIDVSSKLGAFFAEHYDGELEVEAIRAAAGELGLQPDGTSPPPVTGTDPDVAAQGRAQRDLSSGTATEPGATVDRDPREAGMDAFNAELAKGRPRQDAAAAYFGTVLSAAAGGDDRVLIDPSVQVAYE